MTHDEGNVIMSANSGKPAAGRAGLNRREMVHLGMTAGVALVAGVAVEGGQPPTASRRPGEPFELEEATIAALGAKMARGELTSERLCRLYLQRIEALDRRGPKLASIIEVNPDALAIARQLDAERAKGSTRGPLHGIPVVIKDNLATADRMQTTAGSLALVGARPARDAFVVRKLRRAGAVILAKTNLSEWANFRSTHSSSGWSGRGGQCRNPYALDRSPCGSSSGTAVAVAANLAAVGIGTETDGSVVCPSAASSVVGIKPTVGRVGRSGIIPISHTQDTAGAMARTVTDAAILLYAIAGRDPADTATAEAKPMDSSVADLLDAKGLQGARIGVARKVFFGYSPEADAVIEEALKTMSRLGATIVDPADIPHAGDYDDAEMTVLLYEFKADLNAYLRALGPGAPTLAELIRFNSRHREREMPYFGQEIFLDAEAKGPLTDPEYRKALATCRRLSRKEGLDEVFRKHRLDAVVAPTGAPPWTIDLVNGDHYLGGSSTPAAVSGYPSITVPAGYVFGLPVGLSWIGRPFGEASLIRLAYAFEQGARVRRAPQFLPTARL